MLSKKIALAAQLLCIALVSCANNKALELGEEPGNYIFPITKENYAYTVYGFYLSRDTKFGDEIVYEVVQDMRQIRMDLLQNYDTTEHFKRSYPHFIRYKGKTDCGKNTATVEQMNMNMEVIYSNVEAKPNEISKALCTLKQMAAGK